MPTEELETCSSTSHEEDEKVDFDSFIRAEENSIDKSSGKARLISCEHISSTEDVPRPYDRRYGNYNWSSHLVFEAEKTDGSEIRVVTPDDRECAERLVCKEWADTRDISSLAGKTVPVKHVRDDVYRIAEFKESGLNYVPTENVKSLVEDGTIYYKDGKWKREPWFVMVNDSLYVLMYMLASIPALAPSIYVLSDLDWSITSSLVLLALMSTLTISMVSYIKSRFGRRTR